MKWFVNLLKSQRLVVALGFLFLIALVWLVGNYLFELSATTCLIATLIIFIIWVVWLMLEMARANRGAALLEQSLRAQADEQLMSVRPEKREEIEELRQQLTTAIDSLKRTKLGKGRSGVAALYALPWYMFIGPPASGKTTAIRNSGLEFPFGADHEFQGVGGTRNCDWWFTNSAILLDTAGRWTTEQEDREEWLAFLDILKKHRRRQPINGVLIGISISELLNARVNEIEGHAKNMRKRIDELIQRLGVRFPVYLIFTKCDLLNGFVEFFEDFSRTQREQIWGCTFSQEQQQQASNPRAVFEQEFQILYDSLIGLRLARLTSNMKRENRRRVYVFPLEFYSAKENLAHFIGKLFQPNPYQESPVFRGFYFASGTQEGLPIDRVIQSVADAFGLAPELVEQFSPGMETKSYFIKELFTDVVIPDERMVGLTSRSVRSRRLMRLGVIAGAVIALIAFILGVSQAYIRNKLVVDEVGDAITQMQKSSPKNGLEYFNHLDGLRERLVQLEDRADRPPILNFGMDRSRTLLEPAYKLYYKSFNEPVVAPKVYNKIKEHLRDIGMSAATYEENYNDLKAYLLLGSERGRTRSDTANQNFLNQHFISTLRRELPAGLMGEIVERQVRFFVRGLGNNDEDDVAFKFAPQYENDQTLITEARRRLYKAPSVEGVAADLIRAANDRVPSLTLSAIIGGGNRDFFRIDGAEPAIAGAFTKAGWDNYIKNAIDQESSNPGRDDWVLGLQGGSGFPPGVQNQQDMHARLERLYYNGYIREWQNFLSNLEPAAFGTLQIASQRLKILSDGSASPITILLKRAAEETTFESGISQRAKEAAGGTLSNLGKKLGIGDETPSQAQPYLAAHPVDRQFAGVHALVGEGGNGGSATNLQALLGYLVGVSDGLEKLKDDPGTKSKESAAKVLQQQAGEIPEAMKGIRSALNTMDLDTREMVRKLFEQPVRLAWPPVLNDAQQYLNAKWQNEVVTAFAQNLGGYYPFNRNGSDAPQNDVAGFFAPQGTLLGFASRELGPFVVDENSWQPREWEGYGIQLSNQTRAAFRRAKDLSATLSSGAVTFDLQLVPSVIKKQRLTKDPPNYDFICLNIGGDEGEDKCFEFDGRQKPGWVKYMWPGPQDGRGASITFRKGSRLFGLLNAKKVYEKNAPGYWGWFRLLSEARVVARGGALYEVTWALGKEQGFEILVTYFLKANSANNPFSSGFLSFNCPRQLN